MKRPTALISPAETRQEEVPPRSGLSSLSGQPHRVPTCLWRPQPGVNFIRACAIDCSDIYAIVASRLADYSVAALACTCYDFNLAYREYPKARPRIPEILADIYSVDDLLEIRADRRRPEFPRLVRKLADSYQLRHPDRDYTYKDSANDALVIHRHDSVFLGTRTSIKTAIRSAINFCVLATRASQGFRGSDQNSPARGASIDPVEDSPEDFAEFTTRTARKSAASWVQGILAASTVEYIPGLVRYCVRVGGNWLVPVLLEWLDSQGLPHYLLKAKDHSTGVSEYLYEIASKFLQSKPVPREPVIMDLEYAATYGAAYNITRPAQIVCSVLARSQLIEPEISEFFYRHILCGRWELLRWLDGATVERFMENGAMGQHISRVYSRNAESLLVQLDSFPGAVASPTTTMALEFFREKTWEIFSEYLARAKHSYAVLVNLLETIVRESSEIPGLGLGLARDILRAYRRQLLPVKVTADITELFDRVEDFAMLYDGFLLDRDVLSVYYREWNGDVEYAELVYFYSAGGNIEDALAIMNPGDTILEWPGEYDLPADVSEEAHNQAALVAAKREGREIRNSLGLASNSWDIGQD